MKNFEIKKQILDKIKEYDKIIVSRHIRPDGDCTGGTKGLVDILKNNETVSLSFINKDDIFIKNHKLYIDKGVLGINKSKVFIDAVSDEKANFELNVHSHKFDVKDAVELLKTNLVIPNGTEILSFFKDINGSFNFGINITNKGINGLVNINQSSLKVIPLNN